MNTILRNAKMRGIQWYKKLCASSIYHDEFALFRKLYSTTCLLASIHFLFLEQQTVIPQLPDLEYH